MKNVSFSWNEMLFAMQKTDFNVLELFCRASYVRASMHRITSFELLRTLIAVLVQKANEEMQAHICWKASFCSERKLVYAILRVKLEYMIRCFFLMKWNVICNAEDRF